MRLHERTLKEVRIAARRPETDALGGQAEGFSTEEQIIRACLLPEDGGLKRTDGGMVSSACIRLLLPADAAVHAGDGAYVDGRAYLVEAVQPWTAHQEAICRLLP